MNEAISSLSSLGLTLPSPAYIFGAIVFGLIGLGAYRSGRVSQRKVTMWLGVVLMVYPYLISSTWWMYLVGLALCAGLWADRR